ncbi:hypothetical protein [Pengzhenrongella sicca]|uniref:Uncharacterized protein n=1 Tax=Pengzhenrongella sicca TaxID=2819238 RepID=A0A8A4ZDL7_9MICO|nr:hypothetical protein [Pengzhenrongella sicca]QTE30052.1 hypothetical protein J4E96_03235 [Pengzhenrongella sicca]
MNVGDAFAKAYDLLEAMHPIALQLSVWSEDPVMRAASREASASIQSTGQVRMAALEVASPPALLGILSVLDRVLTRSSPLSTSTEPLHRRLRETFQRTGRFNDSTDGAVLPRYVEGGRPRAMAEGLDEVFKNVRVRKATWDRCTQVNLHAPTMRRFDIVVPASKEISIAALPLAGPGDILMLHDITPEDVNVYLASPGPKIAPRVPQAMRKLRDSGASLGLIPEATLDDGILAAWRAASDVNNPDWVLVGSGPVHGDYPGGSAPNGTYATKTGAILAPNRAVLMHGPTGRVIAVQDKRYGFTILPDIKAAYLLKSAPDQPLGEGIIQGTSLTVIESRVGRVAMLVCEDLDRLAQDGPMLRELGVSLVLVPVIAPPLLAYRWQHQASNALAKDVGSTVITINSLALGRDEIVNDPKTGDDIKQPATTLQVIVPEANSYTTFRDPQGNPRHNVHTDAQDAMTLRNTTIRVP